MTNPSFSDWGIIKFHLWDSREREFDRGLESPLVFRVSYVKIAKRKVKESWGKQKEEGERVVCNWRISLFWCCYLGLSQLKVIRTLFWCVILSRLKVIRAFFRCFILLLGLMYVWTVSSLLSCNWKLWTGLVSFTVLVILLIRTRQHISCSERWFVRIHTRYQASVLFRVLNSNKFFSNIYNYISLRSKQST